MIKKVLEFVGKSREERGAAMIEYGLLVAATTLMSAAALSIFGHKTSDLYALGAAVLPGAHADDNGPIQSGKVIETAVNAGGAIALDAGGIAAAGAAPRLADNTGIPDADLTALVVEP